MRINSLPLALVIGLWLTAPAFAQLSLPGATAPAPVGSVVKPATHAARPHPKVAAAPPSPAEGTLAGKTLHLDGGKSEISFAARDKTVDLARLLLAGTRISHSTEDCQIDVSGLPLPLTPVGQTGGVSRFTIPVPACPFSFDVLDGAILVADGTPDCVFKEADCSVRPAGLWGPTAGEIGPDQVKVIERERTQAERSVRAAYQGLVHSTKDRAVIRTIASEQAGFSSKREEFCRDYIGEGRHGFCAARVTSARAATLETQLAAAEADKELRKKTKGRN